MGFWGSDYREYYRTTNDRTEKQHINLSVYALNTIVEDQLAFGIDSFASFINRVFKNFYQDAFASVVIHTETEKKRLNKFFDGTSVSEDVKDKFIEAYINDYRESSKKQIQSYPKGIGKKFRINNENYEYLLFESRENEFYGEMKAGSYLKAVVEEYTRKPYIERERIFFKDYIDKINFAIKNDYCLTISTGNNMFEMAAFGVRQDPSQNFNYLIGKSLLIGSEKNSEPVDGSFRISRIKKIDIREVKKSLFSNEETRIQFQKAVEKRGVQFMGGDDSQQIEVELTPKGISMYNNMQFLRPSYIEKNDNTFKFDCTLTQAEFYFFKFGKEVEIINPPSLAEKFKAMYHEAEENYKH